MGKNYNQYIIDEQHKGKYKTTEIIINPITQKELTLTWDYHGRYPTEQEREATRQYAINLQKQEREKANEGNE
jgi:hypothetical protein